MFFNLTIMKEWCKKISYGTEYYAIEFIKKFNKTKNANNPVKLRAYLCEVCRTWHITSKPHRSDALRDFENKLTEKNLIIKSKNKEIGLLQQKVKEYRVKYNLLKNEKASIKDMDFS